ncbi:beta-glucoside-specific PTS transporter subunit IIABC [Pediococcus pentosaceus]|uniref:beta-glucoside-specific PTS transporter subunit IIABC n=1 Tax=Pediococcus pentosaceus TaxID=1255 RepID=UPI0021E7F684|nr:beta-glucoside-specific PTS transporter subunit IIABC [Pediococcus pentosaceus]MCV3330394.1 beta-glucoside-specific PTS transporter subunit IIABC [Pediococcus pentosaceus]
MSKDYKQLATAVVTAIGGEDNVIDLYHCITRLRFRLKDQSKAHANIDEIKKIPGVLSVVEANGQFQVVIGNDVDKAYDAVMDQYKIQSALEEGNGDTVATDAPKGNPLTRFFNVLSSIFNPVIMPLAGSGMIKALLVICTTFGWMSAKSSTYLILTAAGNAVFYFLPLFLAISAAKVFKANQFIALAIVAALLEPNFTGMITKNGVTVDFFGIPAILMTYSGTVIPAIVAIYVYSLFERKVLKRWVPKSLEIFLTPMIGLLIMVPLTVLVIGPIGVYLGDAVGNGVNFISVHSGLLAGAIIGGGWTYLVMIGIHWGVVPIMVNNIATRGYDTIRPMVAAATFASAGAALGVFFKTKDKDVKSLALSSLVPALLGGVTEPIVYGLSVRFKRPLIAQTIAGAIAGGFMGALQTKAIVYVFPALTTLPAFLGKTFVFYLIGITMAFFLSAILTYVIGLGEEGESAKDTTPQLHLPVHGQVMPLNEVDDEAFASRAMGDGVAVQPTDGNIYAPVSGEVLTVFPTQHAVGIRTAGGIEVLVHIGINTVDLKGEGFNMTIKQGDHVKVGQQIGTVDLALLQKRGYDATTMLIVTNMQDAGPFEVVDADNHFYKFNQAPVVQPAQA